MIHLRQLRRTLTTMQLPRPAPPHAAAAATQPFTPLLHLLNRLLRHPPFGPTRGGIQSLAPAPHHKAILPRQRRPRRIHDPAPQIAAGGLAGDDVNEGVPEALQGEDEGFGVVEAEDDGLGVDDGVEAIYRGGDLCRERGG